MAVIRNKQTGEVRFVEDKNLGDYGVSRPSPTPTPQVSSKPSQKPSPDLLETRTIPTIGALIGGTAGSLLGPAGGIGGAAAGYAGGDVIRRGIRDLVGRGPKNVLESLNDTQESLKGAGESAIYQGVGMGIGKALGLVAHPIAPFIGKVNNILANSPAKIDLGAILENFRPQFLQQMAQRGLATEAIPAYVDIATNTAAAAQAFKPHDPGVIDDVISILNANQFKRNLTSEIGKHYGEFSGARIEGQKMLARLLRQAIEKEEPGVMLPNKIAGAMYGAQEPIEQMLRMLPFGTGGIARYAGSAPLKLLQTLIPQGGGYLNTLFPALFHASRPE